MFSFTTGKAVSFVIVFLPGFLALALAQSITKLVLSEFEFAYLGIALSLLIMLVVKFLRAILELVVGFNRKKNSSPDQFQRDYFDLIFAVPAIFLVALLVGKIAEHDLMTKSMVVLFGDQTSLLSRHDPFYFLLKNWNDCKLSDISPRSSSYMSGMKIRTPKAHKPWVVVRGEKLGYFEGYPRFFSSDREGRLQIFLAPACRIVNIGNQQVRKPISGNGILLVGLSQLEFVDVSKSECIIYFERSRRDAVEGAAC